MKQFIEQEMEKRHGELLSMLREQRVQNATDVETPIENISSKSKQNGQAKSGKSSRKPSKKTSKPSQIVLQDGLLDVFQREERDNQSKYDALKAADYIGSLEEFLN